MRIQDETFQDIFYHPTFPGNVATDGGVSPVNASSGKALTGLTCTGPLFAELVAVRGWPMQRPVAPLDTWFFTVWNTDPNDPATPELHLFFDEGLKGRRGG